MGRARWEMGGERAEGRGEGEASVRLVPVISACKTWLSMVITFSIQRQQRELVQALLQRTPAAQAQTKRPVFVCLLVTVVC